MSIINESLDMSIVHGSKYGFRVADQVAETNNSLKTVDDIFEVVFFAADYVMSPVETMDEVRSIKNQVLVCDGKELEPGSIVASARLMGESNYEGRILTVVVKPGVNAVFYDKYLQKTNVSPKENPVIIEIDYAEEAKEFLKQHRIMKARSAHGKPTAWTDSYVDFILMADLFGFGIEADGEVFVPMEMEHPFRKEA